MQRSSTPTTVTVDAQIPAVHVIREFEAPPMDVYRAHVDPDIIVRWLGPDDLVMTIDRWDARTGGEFRYEFTSADDAFSFRGCFHDLRPGDRMVQTFTFEGWPDSVSLDTATLEGLPNGHTRLSLTSLFGSFEERDQWVASGMEDGVDAGYTKLDGVLAERLTHVIAQSEPVEVSS